MRKPTRLLAAAAGAAMLATTFGAVSAAPAQAYTYPCKKVINWDRTDEPTIRVPAATVNGGMSCIMKRGTTGPAVSHLQKNLRDYGYSLAIDGDFGPGTESALKKFQKWRGIKADGIYGPQTRDNICWDYSSGIGCSFF